MPTTTADTLTLSVRLAQALRLQDRRVLTVNRDLVDRNRQGLGNDEFGILAAEADAKAYESATEIYTRALDTATSLLTESDRKMVAELGDGEVGPAASVAILAFRLSVACELLPEYDRERVLSAMEADAARYVDMAVVA